MFLIDRKKSAEDVLSVATDPIILSQGLSFTSGSILQSSPVSARRSPSPSFTNEHSLRASVAPKSELINSKSHNELITNIEDVSSKLSSPVRIVGDNLNIAESSEVIVMDVFITFRN